MPRKSGIEGVLDADEEQIVARNDTSIRGPISLLSSSYSKDGDNLLGFVLDMSYDQATIVTCDAWKRKCGGVPKNSFVVIRQNPLIGRSSTGESATAHLILARITEAVGTPVSNEIQQTVFTIHKVQAVIDPYTNAELQWSALKATILGTYYDDGSQIAFGNDIDTYISPHFYEVYVPTASDLERLINSFVSSANPMQIGDLRYTETQTGRRDGHVAVRVAPHDFIENRTALFGKTRMGKSNTVKVIADMMIRSDENVGQIIFDLDGEYSNTNEQDHTSIFELHPNECVRYSLNPDSRKVANVADPLPLMVNFFEQVELGHTIIKSLWDNEFSSRPNYILPLLDWEPCDPININDRFTDHGDKTRYQRTLSMYYATLTEAGYPSNLQTIRLHVSKEIREALAQEPILQGVAVLDNTAKTVQISEEQPLQAAARVYRALYFLHSRSSNDTNLFPPSSRTGQSYFDPVNLTLLRMMGDTSISGALYLRPFSRYHDLNGSHIVASIKQNVDLGKTVIIDLANADEVVTEYYSRLICTSIFRNQTAKFTSGSFKGHSVLFYFEEAHNLFRRDDKDLTSIYNRLAKEGAKNRIGMVYATQSMTTLSPDLLKNTENFFIAHLNDDREIRELTSKYEFRDIALDVQRSKTRGYVRMITLSHRYALPVQIRKFEPPNEGTDGLH